MSQSKRKESQVPMEPDDDPLNRRRESRFPVAIEASVCLLGDLTGERAEISHAYVHDLSRGGMRLTTYAPVHEGEEVLIKFASPGSGARTRRVKVYWVEELSPGRFHVGAGAAEDSTSSYPRPPKGKPKGQVLHLSADPLNPTPPPGKPPAEGVAPSSPSPRDEALPETEPTPGEAASSPSPKEQGAPQVTHITLQTNRGPLDSVAMLVLAMAFLTSMGLLVAWQWYQIK